MSYLLVRFLSLFPSFHLEKALYSKPDIVWLNVIRAKDAQELENYAKERSLALHE